MRRRIGRLTRLFLAASLLAAGLTAASRADDAGSLARPGMGDAGGGEIYSHICQGCHMPEGAGASGAGHYPRLAGDPALASWRYVALIVLGGKNGMPAFGLPAGEAGETLTVTLSDAQIADVVNYVRSHFGNHYKQQVTAVQVAVLRRAPGQARP